MEARLADLLAGLSRLADLGFGLQAGEALRSCALATRLARSLDLPEDDVRAATYTEAGRGVPRTRLRMPMSRFMATPVTSPV